MKLFYDIANKTTRGVKKIISWEVVFMKRKVRALMVSMVAVLALGIFSFGIAPNCVEAYQDVIIDRPLDYGEDPIKPTVPPIKGN